MIDRSIRTISQEKLTMFWDDYDEPIDQRIALLIERIQIRRIYLDSWPGFTKDTEQDALHFRARYESLIPDRVSVIEDSTDDVPIGPADEASRDHFKWIEEIEDMLDDRIKLLSSRPDLWHSLEDHEDEKESNFVLRDCFEKAEGADLKELSEIYRQPVVSDAFSPV